MTTIYLIRHSESLGLNNINYLSELDDQLKNERLPLSPIGEERAQKLSKITELQNIDVVFSSEYERAISTAKYISKNNNLVLNVTGNLNERKVGDASNLTKEFWLTQFEDEDAKAIGGESRKEVTNRMLDFIKKELKEYEGKRIVMVSHGTAITFLLMNWCELLDVDLETKKRHITFNKKDVINDAFNCPELFKLEFDNDFNLVSIERIIV